MQRLTSLFAVVFGLLCISGPAPAAADPLASLEPARKLLCPPERSSCEEVHAIVFVHGIYGHRETFVNSDTGFDWPRDFPTEVNGQLVDVYRLNYRTALLSWAEEMNPRFDKVAKAVEAAMQPMRKRRYHTIGFVAHSLGGNVVSTYVHKVKSKRGHPARSQHAYTITLATPVLGSQVADLGSALKSLLGIKDDFLASLKRGNLYLRMLQDFREDENEKEALGLCRPVHLHAAYEKKYLGPILVVSPDSAAVSVREMVKSPVVGFSLNHSEIAKPDGPKHEIYQWVFNRIVDEFARVAIWDSAHPSLVSAKQLCKRINFLPE